MKNLIKIIVLVILFGSCSKNDIPIESTGPKVENLGLSPNNSFPYWPDTWLFLDDNQWFHWQSGNILTVMRKDNVFDDGFDQIEYTFIVEKNKWIVPLNIKRIRCVVYLGIPFYTVFDKPIVNFRVQAYEENKLLACTITTPLGNADQSSVPMLDKMWVDLSK